MKRNGIEVRILFDIIHKQPGITTPELAEAIQCSVTMARWYVLQCDELEYYDGNHVRFKAQGEEGTGR